MGKLILIALGAAAGVAAAVYASARSQLEGGREAMPPASGPAPSALDE